MNYQLTIQPSHPDYRNAPNKPWTEPVHTDELDASIEQGAKDIATFRTINAMTRQFGTSPDTITHDVDMPSDWEEGADGTYTRRIYVAALDDYLGYSRYDVIITPMQ